MEIKEKVILVLPGDKITLVADRPLRLYYRVEEIEGQEIKLELSL